MAESPRQDTHGSRLRDLRSRLRELVQGLGTLLDEVVGTPAPVLVPVPVRSPRR